MQQICKMEKLEIRAVIKYLCKTGMPPNETTTSWNPWEAVSFLYSSKRGRESAKDDGRSGRPKVATADENVKIVHILVMCEARPAKHSSATWA